MFCIQCGSELREDAIFCDKCGSKVANDSEPLTKKTKMLMNNMTVIIILCIILFFGILSWGLYGAYVAPNMSPSPTSATTITAYPDTTEYPSSTPFPTEGTSITQVPTNTPMPTTKPLPTAKPTPKPTPKPTSSPTPVPFDKAQQSNLYSRTLSVKAAAYEAYLIAKAEVSDIVSRGLAGSTIYNDAVAVRDAHKSNYDNLILLTQAFQDATTNSRLDELEDILYSYELVY